MTEEEWLNCGSTYSYWTAKRAGAEKDAKQSGGRFDAAVPTKMPLASFTFRKARLWGVACCGRASHRLPTYFLNLLKDVEVSLDDSECVAALRSLYTRSCERLDQLEVAERDNYQPGVFTASEATVFVSNPDVEPVELGVNLGNNLACSAEEIVRADTEDCQRTPEAETVGKHEEAAFCALFRDIFGNPFRPTSVDPKWLTATVVALAEGIYADRAFDRMPILADALEDVGCDHADILNHCWGDGPHVRGCWVVDLVLGKE